MTLQMRNGAWSYEIGIPDGSRLESTASGSAALLIPGPNPGDTWSWLPAPSILSAARRGELGLRLVSERQSSSLPVRTLDPSRCAG